MTTLPKIDQSGAQVGELQVPEKLFAAPINPQLMRESLEHFLANQRQGSRSTKTRGEVRGGGAKPWRQKRTGRARHGSIRSPIWRKGGVTFAPKPQSHSYKFNKKKRRQALYSALSSLQAEERIKVVEEIPVGQPKTKQIVEFLQTLSIEGKTLILLDKMNRSVYLAARN